MGAAIGVLRTNRREGREKGLFEGNYIGSTTYYTHISTSIHSFIKKKNKHTASVLSGFYDSLFRGTEDNGSRRQRTSRRIDMSNDFFSDVWYTVCTFLRKSNKSIHSSNPGGMNVRMEMERYLSTISGSEGF